MTCIIVISTVVSGLIGVSSCGKFLCLECGQKFSRKSHALRHYQSKHMPQESARCHVCKKLFKNAQSRDTHRAAAHGISRKMVSEAKLSKIDM